MTIEKQPKFSTQANLRAEKTTLLDANADETTNNSENYLTATKNARDEMQFQDTAFNCCGFFSCFNNAPKFASLECHFWRFSRYTAFFQSHKS